MQATSCRLSKELKSPVWAVNFSASSAISLPCCAAVATTATTIRMPAQPLQGERQVAFTSQTGRSPAAFLQCGFSEQLPDKQAALIPAFSSY